MLRFLLLALLSLQLASCKQASLVQRIFSEETDVTTWSNGQKTIQFVGMHHIGKPLFYERVRDIVSTFKSMGYIVYFESARADKMQDSVLQDEYNRKFRRLMGFGLDSTGYAGMLEDVPVLNSLVGQPPYEKLGVTATDVRVDLSQQKLVDGYEAKFGKIVLDEKDWKTPLGDPYPLSRKAPQQQLMWMILDYRNQHVADYITASKDEKIVVIYGALHSEGIFELLQQKDRNWKKLGQ